MFSTLCLFRSFFVFILFESSSEKLTTTSSSTTSPSPSSSSFSPLSSYVWWFQGHKYPQNATRNRRLCCVLRFNAQSKYKTANFKHKPVVQTKPDVPEPPPAPLKIDPVRRKSSRAVTRNDDDVTTMVQVQNELDAKKCQSDDVVLRPCGSTRNEDVFAAIMQQISKGNKVINCDSLKKLLQNMFRNFCNCGPHEFYRKRLSYESAKNSICNYFNELLLMFLVFPQRRFLFLSYYTFSSWNQKSSVFNFL